MQTKTRKLGKLVRLATIIVAFLTISLNASAYYSHNRHNASQVINKTAYIIDQAYQVADYYNYWNGEYISRAVYYNDYAERQFYRRNYRTAIYFSLKAREYALMVIDGCDDYWDYYYYENYGWSRTYGYNPYYTGHPGNHYGHYYNYYNNNYNNYHNNHGNNPNYNPNRPNNYNDGRGTNGRSNAFDPNKPDNNGTSTGHFSNAGKYKNIDTENYFDKDEKEILKKLPDDNSMENQFKIDNKDVRFDNNTIKNNPALINQNRTKAEAFKKNTPESSRKSINIAEPKRIDEINSKKVNEQNFERSKEIKTNKPNELKPLNNNRVIEAKPIKNNNSEFRNIESNKTINTNNYNTVDKERANRNNNFNNKPRKEKEPKTINIERKDVNRTINQERKSNNKTQERKIDNTTQERKIDNKTENKIGKQEKEKSNLRTR